MTMPSSQFCRIRRMPVVLPALTLALSATLSGCGTVAQNRGLTSVHQPVVDHTSLVLDVSTGPDGLTSGEQQRIADWFAAMGLRYGDKVMLTDPLASAATRAGVEVALGKYGLQLSPATPLTAVDISAGSARITIIRASADVPGCPDWSDNTTFNPNDATSRGFGCAVNGNLAAMIANPDDLIKGAPDTGVTTATLNNKAVNAYVNAKPGAGGGGSSGGGGGAPKAGG